MSPQLEPFIFFSAAVIFCFTNLMQPVKKKNTFSFFDLFYTVPSTWKNKGGVQEKLGIELTFRVDKSLLLLQAFWGEKKKLFFIFLDSV